MTSTVNKGLDSVKDGATSTGESLNTAAEYSSDKLTDAKDAVKDTSSSTYDKVGETLKDGMTSVGNGLSNVGGYVADKYDGVKKAMTPSD